MNQKGFVNVLLIVLVVVLVGALGYVTLVKKSPEPNPTLQKNTNNINAVTPPTTANTTPPKPQLTYPDIKTFLPSKATLNEELKLDIEGDGINEVAFAYAIPSDQTGVIFTTVVKILKYTDSSGWKVAFEDTDMVGNGSGAKDAVGIDKVSGPNNKEAVLVILTESGAGIAKRWHLIAFTNGKISKLDPSPIRQKVLADRGYQDWGYNHIKSTGNFVVEIQPGYSKNTARCCPDNPSIEIKFRFTGNSIELDSVREL